MHDAGERRGGPASDAVTACLIVLSVFLIHVLSPVRTSFDSRWTIPTAVSLAYEGDANLDEYGDIVREEEFYAIEHRDGHMFNRYPLGPSLIALPYVLAGDLLARSLALPDSSQLVLQHRWALVETIVASSLMALSAGVIFSIARLSGLTLMRAVIIAALFAFGTSAWSIGSRALWQHGPAMFVMTAALYCFVRADGCPAMVLVAAGLLAFGLTIRPTNAITLVLLGSYALWRYPRERRGYVLITGVILALFAWCNFVSYGRIASPYYLPQGQPIGRLEDLPVIMLGHLVSPNRGLFVSSPVLLFAAWGVLRKRRLQGLSTLDGVLLVQLGVYFVVISRAVNWWAGHSFGARFLSDVVPILVYFTAFALPAERTDSPGRRGIVWGVFWLLFSWSVFSHGRAALSWDVWAWNGDPISVDSRPDRAWDIGDLQVLRGLGDSR